MILLDTSVLIEYFRSKDKAQTFFWRLMTNEKEFAISAVTHYEIYVGVRTQEQFSFWSQLLSDVTIIPFDVVCSFSAAQMGKYLKSKNQMISMSDIFIAATAVAHHCSLATLNARHFERINDVTLISAKQQ